MIRIAILGGGGWGTGLAVVLSQSRRPHEIRLWAREAAVVECIQRDHENKIYLPGVPLPESVSASTDLREILNGADILLGVVPSAHARSVGGRHRQRHQRLGTRHAPAHERAHRAGFFDAISAARRRSLWPILCP